MKAAMNSPVNKHETTEMTHNGSKINRLMEYRTSKYAHLPLQRCIGADASRVYTSTNSEVQHGN